MVGIGNVVVRRDIRTGERQEQVPFDGVIVFGQDIVEISGRFKRLDPCVVDLDQFGQVLHPETTAVKPLVQLVLQFAAAFDAQVIAYLLLRKACRPVGQSAGSLRSPFAV